MKKVVLIALLCLSICLGLVGCGLTSEEKADPISYMQETLYTAENANFRVSLTSGRSESLFVADGKVDRMETLRALTSDTGRVAYTLKAKPADLAALEAACPGVRLAVEGDLLVAEFPAELSVDAVNAALLPGLLKFGVLAVQPGRSLADAYLGGFAKAD